MAKPINPKVTAATAGALTVALICGLIEWLAGVDIPDYLEALAGGLGTFYAGWLTSDGTPGRYEATVANARE